MWFALVYSDVDMSTAIQNRFAFAGALPRPGSPPSSESVLVNPLRDGINITLAACLSVLIICGSVLLCPDLLDWCLLPIFVCGILGGIDMIAWLRGKVDLFDPLGVFGAYAYYFFFVAPLLTVMWDYHTRGLAPVPDWTTWIGWLSALNAAGLAIYVFGRRLFQVRRPPTVWQLRGPYFFASTAIVLPVALACQIAIFFKFGGLLGFIEAFTSNIGTDTFEGMGYLFLVAETFPVFCAIALLVWKRDFLRRRSWVFLAVLMVAFFALKLAFGGLRGSRSLTVWGMFWFVGAIHVWIRPVPRKMLVLGLLFLVVFMYAYGFYKDEGVAALEVFGDPSKIDRMEHASGRTIDAVLLGDMARTDVQAALLYRVASVGEYRRAYGLTYLEAFAFAIPRAIWPDRPDGKVQWGTEALYGERAYTRASRSTYIYGLVGEEMLNFPPIVAPLAFLGFAFVMSKMRAMLLLDKGDMRWLFVPVLSILAVLLVSFDLDNALFISLSIALAPLALMRACCHVVPRSS